MRRSLFFFGIIVVFLYACSVRTPVPQEENCQNPDDLKEVTIVLREFTVKPGLSPKAEAAMAQCKYGAKNYLGHRGLFKSIKEDDNHAYENPVLIVDAKLNDIRIVNTAARVVGWIFVGRSHMKILATIYDPEGNKIAEKELFGAPNVFSSAYSFGQNDTSLATRMGYLLGDYLIAESCKYSDPKTAKK